jgi:hypothetical protein
MRPHATAVRTSNRKDVLGTFVPYAMQHTDTAMELSSKHHTNHAFSGTSPHDGFITFLGYLHARLTSLYKFSDRSTYSPVLIRPPYSLRADSLIEFVT